MIHRFEPLWGEWTAEELLGADILAADAAAAEEYPLPAIIFDMGTATTATVVDKDRRYLGGAILAGVKLGISALFSGTAQLPSVSVEAPPKAICDTAQRVHDGIGYTVEQRPALREFLTAYLRLRGRHRFRFCYQYHTLSIMIS